MPASAGMTPTEVFEVGWVGADERAAIPGDVIPEKAGIHFLGRSRTSSTPTANRRPQ